MAVAAFAIVAGAITTALVAGPLIRATFQRRRRRSAARRSSPIDDLPLVHHAVARSIDVSPTKREGLVRVEIGSDLGAVSFDGPQDLRLRPGDSYSLALDAGRRPRRFTNHTLAATWDLPLSAARALPSWLPGVPMVVLGTAALAVVVAFAAMLAPWVATNAVAAAQRVLSDPDWLPESGAAAGDAVQTALRQLAVVLSIASVVGGIVTNRQARHRLDRVPPMAIRDPRAAMGWVEVPPTAVEWDEVQPDPRRK
jgi:hypothetical protein